MFAADGGHKTHLIYFLKNLEIKRMLNQLINNHRTQQTNKKRGKAKGITKQQILRY